ncbi:diguanylate cyclase [Ralstonia pickettii]|uniref:diguanylate cyclase n=1 Tax=Ralstonia pickettii TaxID=329 RepID=A0A7X2HNK0_RALPI|nr:sensor domain-containing diguanylate cyclase [Ralstonia pickettii]MRS99671.1 diguanylate cyclase [Ralstonia pickettii]
MCIRRIAGAFTSRPTLFILGAAVIASAITVLTAALLYQMRFDAMLRARELSENITLILERDIERNIEIYDLTLRAVVDGVHSRDVMALPPMIRQIVLFDASSTARDLGSLLVTNAAGQVVIDSRSVPARTVFVGDRDYFLAQKATEDVGLFISKPFIPRVDNSGPTIGLSRRLKDEEGRFSGIVVGTLRVNYFTRLFEGVNVGTEGMISLSGRDGTLYASRPNAQHVAAIAQLEETSVQAHAAISNLDGVEWLLTSRQIGNYPLVVTVGLPVQHIYQNWKHRAGVIGAIVAALNTLLLASSVFFAQQLRKRRDMEHQLEILANIDGLTGLATRRALDTALDAEWRRANRDQRPLGMLMIDVDEFKRYNDHYGHGAGDAVLRMISRCIRDSIQRPGDIAGRYGGEEFCVLLPGADQAGTLLVAEKIRATIEAQNEPHAFSQHGRITVSVGACNHLGTPRCTESAAECLSRADVHLYAAKAAGRNLVMPHPRNPAAVNSRPAAHSEAQSLPA